MSHRASTNKRKTPSAEVGAPARAVPRRAATPERRPSDTPRSMGGSRGARSGPLPPTRFHPSQRTTAAPDRPLRVIVVEDEAIIAMEIEMVLQDLGAEVVGLAMTAAEAMRLAELHRPDCATMDISIKGDRDGVSAAIQIYETLGIRSIFVSAYGNEETRARAERAHPLGWVMKPFGTQDIRSALDRVLDDDPH